jgi:trigger factor
MQVTQTNEEGLKREFKVVVSANDIKTKMDSRLQEIGQTVRLPGFRPGKVPMPILKKRYGPAVMGEVLERAVSDSSNQAMMERGLRPALQPKIEVKSFAENADLEYTLAVEVLPDIQPANFAEMQLERMKVDVPDAEIDKALNRIAEQHERSEKITEERPSQSGDIVLIDFVGSVDGKEFQGGSATDFRLKLGSGQFIPGFEDQLTGVKSGEQRTINVTFPEAYANKELAGKPASFAVRVKEIHKPVAAELNDELATQMGLDDLETLRKAVRDQLGRDYARIVRARLKRQLLDKLADAHQFAVPQGMVDLEFDAIWKNVEEERKQGPLSDPALANKSEDELKAEFRRIAERRVRLGLLLSEVGRLNNIQVSQEEVNRALVEQARRFPGQERQVIEYYRNNADALAQLRAPLFEDKVIDFITEMAKVAERPTTIEELMKEPEDAAA